MERKRVVDCVIDVLRPVLGGRTEREGQNGCWHVLSLQHSWVCRDESTTVMPLSEHTGGITSTTPWTDASLRRSIIAECMNCLSLNFGNLTWAVRARSAVCCTDAFRRAGPSCTRSWLRGRSGTRGVAVHRQSSISEAAKGRVGHPEGEVRRRVGLLQV